MEEEFNEVGVFEYLVDDLVEHFKHTESSSLRAHQPNASVVCDKETVLNSDMTEQQHEPLLDPSEDRLELFPIKHPDLFEQYQAELAAFWTPGEAVFIPEDRSDYDSLTEGEKHFINHVLAFFATSDAIVNENLAMRFYNDVQYPEARMCYSVELMIEAIHSESYAQEIDLYVTDEEQKKHLFNAIREIPIIKKKADWCFKWIESSDLFAERLLAFAFVEGIFFSSSFAAIFYMKKRGLLPFLTFLNELISKDESNHVITACLLYKKLINKLPQERVYDILQEAVDLEIEFTQESLPCDLIGINSRLMAIHVESCADKILELLGYPRLYNVQTPFEFMEMLSMQGKTNFFESRVSSYQLANVGRKKEDYVFRTDAEF